jgi:hypothetical protein
LEIAALVILLFQVLFSNAYSQNPAFFSSPGTKELDLIRLSRELKINQLEMKSEYLPECVPDSNIAEVFGD